MAVADGVVYVPVANLASQWSAKAGLGKADFGDGTGEMLALDVATGKVLWDTKLSQMADGDATVVNDLVFTTTFDGYLVALARRSGRIAWRQKLPAFTNAPIAIQATRSSPRRASPAARARRRRSSRSASAHTARWSRPPRASAEPTRGAVDGAAVFSQNCSSCHTLAAAKAHGTVGPNLDQLKPTRTGRSAAGHQRRRRDARLRRPAHEGPDRRRREVRRERRRDEVAGRIAAPRTRGERSRRSDPP